LPRREQSYSGCTAQGQPGANEGSRGSKGNIDGDTRRLPGILAIFNNVTPGREDEFQEWFQHASTSISPSGSACPAS
jgi:hypothetical protein